MADALCGPSNPLQSFTKHTQVDRTLQQDRLRPRHAPSEGKFRTADPRVAVNADASFHAFETSPAQLFMPQPSQAFHHTSMTPNWASDFQKLHIDNQPLPVAQFRSEAPLIKTTNAGWHNDFLKFHQNDNLSANVVGKQVEYPCQRLDSLQRDAFSPSFQMGPSFYNQQYGQPLQQQSGFDQLQDNSAPQVEQAFLDAFTQAEEMDQCYRQQYVPVQSEVAKEVPQQDIPQETQENIRIGSDAINYIDKAERTINQDQQDADELAKTAGQLLDSVRHDSSEKFQNSQFLGLMRMLRDREIQVRDNDFKMTEKAYEPTSSSINQVSHMPPQNGRIGEEELRPHDPNTFNFPDMNSVYEPEQPTDPVRFTSYTGSWDYPAFSGIRHGGQEEIDVHALHPGGKLYPEQSPPLV